MNRTRSVTAYFKVPPEEEYPPAPPEEPPEEPAPPEEPPEEPAPPEEPKPTGRGRGGAKDVPPEIVEGTCPDPQGGFGVSYAFG